MRTITYQLSLNTARAIAAIDRFNWILQCRIWRESTQPGLLVHLNPCLLRRVK